MSSWAKIVDLVPVNLRNIMSEEVANNFKAKKARSYINTVKPQVQFDIPPESMETETTKLDGEIAKRLQQQFDMEHDENLKRAEEKFNGTSKISVSYSNYRRVPDNFNFESQVSEEEIELEDTRNYNDWDKLEALQKEIRCIPRGYVIKNGRMIAKRDITINNREGTRLDLKLCSNIFKGFKMQHEIHNNKEVLSTAIVGIDDTTRFLVNKMMQNQLIEKVNDVIHIGKEKVILHVTSGPNYTTCGLQREWAIKVVKMLSEHKYMNDQYNFKESCGKQNITKIVHMWVEKEMHNLLRLRRAGIPCPEVMGRKKHILVTTFIGRNGKPAPKLSEAPMDKLLYAIAYDQIVEQMKTLYNEANLIHAGLSEDKILWFDRNCYFFDVSEAVETSHENAFCLLMRDCKNITNFFKGKGVPDICEEDTLFEYITGCDFKSGIAPLKLQVR